MPKAVARRGQNFIAQAQAQAQAQQYIHCRYNNITSKLFGMICLLIIIGWLFSGLVISKWIKNELHLPLSKLVLTGKIHYTTYKDIQYAILSIRLPVTFISSNMNIIKHNIKILPWIKNVRVNKQRSDRLKINLVEFVPIVRWNMSRLIDADGISFSIPTNRLVKEKLPILYGPEQHEKEALVGYQMIIEVLKNSYLNRLMLKSTSITLNGSWKLIINNNIHINLGKYSIIERLERFIELYPELQHQAQIKKKHINYIDLRYHCGAAVSWIPVVKSIT